MRRRVVLERFADGPLADADFKRVVGVRQRCRYGRAQGRIQRVGEAIMEHGGGLDRRERRVLIQRQRKPASESQQGDLVGKRFREP